MLILRLSVNIGSSESLIISCSNEIEGDFVFVYGMSMIIFRE
ncbi:hypothetical protein BH11PSE12_BH11PSE12_10700 [soil metagenome]